MISTIEAQVYIKMCAPDQEGFYRAEARFLGVNAEGKSRVNIDRAIAYALEGVAAELRTTLSTAKGPAW